MNDTIFINCNFLGRCKKWGSLLHKNLAILVPFECWMPKNPKDQDLTWRESPNFWLGFPWKSPRFCEILGVSRYPGIPPSNDENSWICFLNRLYKARDFHEIHADFGWQTKINSSDILKLENPSKKNPPLSHCCPLIGPYYGLIALGGWHWGGVPLDCHHSKISGFSDIWGIFWSP